MFHVDPVSQPHRTLLHILNLDADRKRFVSSNENYVTLLTAHQFHTLVEVLG